MTHLHIEDLKLFREASRVTLKELERFTVKMGEAVQRITVTQAIDTPQSYGRVLGRKPLGILNSGNNWKIEHFYLWHKVLGLGETQDQSSP